MDPINYSLNIPDPMSSFMGAAQLGSGIAAQQAQKAAMLEQKKAAESEQLKNAWEVQNKQQQQEALQFGGQALSAIRNGKPEIAKDLIAQKAVAARNSGDEKSAQAYETWGKIIELDPERAADTVQSMIAANPEGKAVIDNINAIAEENRKAALSPSQLKEAQAKATKAQAEADVAPEAATAAINKTNSETRNLGSETLYRAKTFGLDVDKFYAETRQKLAEMLQKNGQLPEFVAKDVNETATNAIAAQQSAEKMEDLADRLEKASIRGGVAAKVSEGWKKISANQDELTRMRAEYNRIVTPAAMAQYKKFASGSTSDKDIDTAMTGVPKDTDNQETMVSFLRGAAKLQRIDSIMNNAKTEWLGSVRDLGKSKSDVVIDGVKVPAGTTFKNFIDSYVKQKYDAQKTQAAQQPAVLQNRSYMVHAGGGQ